MNASALAIGGDVVAAQHGDRDAFTRLIDATRNVVCSITLAIVRDVPSSEDVAQEVFIAAWGSVEKLRDPASFLPWLRQLARNHAHAFIRARTRFGRRHAPWSDAASTIADPTPDAGRVLIDHEDREALAAALEDLPEESREIVTLYYREGRSARHVGELLGLSEDAVKKRLERARQAVKKNLLDRASEALRSTAPGAGFTAAVVAAIAFGAPATATAATGAAAGAVKTFGGTGVLSKVGIAIGGSVVGAASAALAVLYGARVLWRRARDDRERADLRWFIAVSVLTVLGGSTLFGIGDAHGAAFNVVVWVAFALVLGLSYAVWLPRIVSRREALERLEDPAAAARQRRQRILGYVGIGVGLASGLAGLIYGLTHR
jgi:RNA polymerase sigma factor (sigma-70 family)